ncbi:hypothetical protein ACT7DF_12890 [Bacillus cereus]
MTLLKIAKRPNQLPYRNRLWDEWEDALSTRLQKGAKSNSNFDAMA